MPSTPLRFHRFHQRQPLFNHSASIRIPPPTHPPPTRFSTTHQPSYSLRVQFVQGALTVAKPTPTQPPSNSVCPPPHSTALHTPQPSCLRSSASTQGTSTSGNNNNPTALQSTPQLTQTPQPPSTDILTRPSTIPHPFFTLHPDGFLHVNCKSGESIF